ncbi:MAG: sugar ABC transporter permease [Oscillospiraceae bacterium]|jgi:arabinogalactan oligomer/maltooligosaccharide transport system permease protein|nr:sugar ABC transporter permease [Oscillospiraceae bacterium]
MSANINTSAQGKRARKIPHTDEHRPKFIHQLANGGAETWLSAIIFGFGSFVNGQIIKGLLYLASEVGFILFYLTFGWGYVKDLLTLGTVQQGWVFNEAIGIDELAAGQNSMLILLYSVLTIATLVPLFMIWRNSVKSSYLAHERKLAGIKQPTFLKDVKTLLDLRYHMTLMSLPLITLTLFTALPIIFMVAIAFTNFDATHQPPGKLFTWVGLTNFRNIFFDNPKYKNSFGGILTWTFIWAIFATVTNYLLGMILALMINKQGIKLKKLWRTCFVITIAVPQFVSLMLVSRMFADTGIVNETLKNWNWIKDPIKFLTDPTLARIMVVIINMWVGVPYTMLMTTGILMNIPADLYESANIDGATAYRQFVSITLPYMLFVTGPYLITTFVGNINNFNVIYLLTSGGPLNQNYYQAGDTDLLVTWLYKLTVDRSDYNLASAIGIIIFVIVAAFSLLAYNFTGSVKKEDQFS